MKKKFFQTKMLRKMNKMDKIKFERSCNIKVICNSFDLEVNNFLTRNPVNSRRDAMEKLRNTERKSFINDQGGLMNNFVDFNLENTRKDKREINTTNYVPMPRTLAIPKENI